MTYNDLVSSEFTCFENGVIVKICINFDNPKFTLS